MQSKNISQYYHSYDSYADLNVGTPIKKNPFGSATLLDPQEILRFDKVFIIAEPGHGKTTLIAEIKSILDENHIGYYSKTGTDYHGGKLVKIEGNKYFIFDALDETKDVVASFITIQKFCNENDLKLIISNRTHYLSMISHLFVEENYVFIQLWPFSEDQIKTFLEVNLNGLNYQEDDYWGIIKKSKGAARNSILSIPRYVDEFCKYLTKEKISAQEIGQITKSELFEKVIYYKLDSEDQSVSALSNKKYLTKRVLERLALVMEIHELNRISKDDFITFLDQTDSNISLIFLNLIDLDVLLNRVMKSTGVFLQFENSEFQEYLAAKELVRLGYRFQTIYDLMFDKELHLLLPNWIDVLTFGIELESEFVKPIISFIRNKEYINIDEKLILILLNVTADNFSEDFMNEFFNTIFEYYMAKGRIFYNVNESLAKFVTKSNDRILKPIYKIEELKDAVLHIQSNQILIIAQLAKNGFLNSGQKSLWQAYLLELSLKEEFRSMLSTVFYGLEALGNAAPLLEYMNSFYQRQDEVLNTYLSALTQMDPNHSKVISLINKIVKQGRKISNLDDAINNVSSKEGIVSIFNNLSKYVKNIRRDTFKHGIGFYGLFDSIEQLNSKKVENSIRRFVLRAFEFDQYTLEISKVLEQSIIYVVKKNTLFLEKILPSRTFLYAMDEIVRALAKHIDLIGFKLIEGYLNKENGWRLERLIHLVKYELDNDKDNEIYIYIEQNYPRKEVNSVEMAEISKKRSSIHILRSYYLEGKEFYNRELVPFFVHHFEELQPELVKKDLEEIKTIVAIVLRNYDPERLRIEISEVKGTNTTYNINDETGFAIQLYFRAALLLGEFGLILAYREKLLKTLPRMELFNTKGRDVIDGLINIILPISDKDTQMLQGFLGDRDDDMLVLNAYSFAELVKNLGLYGLNSILLALVKKKNVQHFEKEEVLKVFGSMARGDEDRAALLEVFNSPSNHSKLKDIANAALITNYREVEAIDWRFQELRNRMAPFEMDTHFEGARAVSVFEMEMDHPKFPNCFYGLECDHIYKKMLELLTYSFSIRDNRLNFRYSTYLQQIVTTYFKTFLSTKVIMDLRKTVKEFEVVEQTYSFNGYIDELVKELHNQVRSEQPFLTAVHGLNRILKNSYLPINSNEDLRELIVKIINTEIRNLIENGGFYKLSNDLKEKEDEAKPDIKIGETIIQKTLRIALENALLNFGLRKTDIVREAESLDGLKYDLLISYGFFGPIMVEIKLLHNPEIQNANKRSQYKNKLKKYLGANHNQGIYSIFQIHDRENDIAHYHKLLEEYSDLNNLDITFIKCY